MSKLYDLLQGQQNRTNITDFTTITPLELTVSVTTTFMVVIISVKSDVQIFEMILCHSRFLLHNMVIHFSQHT